MIATSSLLPIHNEAVGEIELVVVRLYLVESWVLAATSSFHVGSGSDLSVKKLLPSLLSINLPFHTTCSCVHVRVVILELQKSWRSPDCALAWAASHLAPPRGVSSFFHSFFTLSRFFASLVEVILSSLLHRTSSREEALVRSRSLNLR